MNEIFLLDNEYSRKKTKEEIEREWQESMKEQVAEFDKLFIEKGIKRERITSATNINSLCHIRHNCNSL